MRQALLDEMFVEVIPVVSCDNEADGLSRLRQGCVNLPWIRKIIDGHFAGQRLSSSIRETSITTEPGELRHAEGVTDENPELDMTGFESAAWTEEILDDGVDELRWCIEQGWYAEGPDDPRESLTQTCR